MRLERGLTQREVAEQMRVQRPAVSKMERKADMSIGRFTEFVILGGAPSVARAAPKEPPPSWQSSSLGSSDPPLVPRRSAYSFRMIAVLERLTVL